MTRDLDHDNIFAVNQCTWLYTVSHLGRRGHVKTVGGEAIAAVHPHGPIGSLTLLTQANKKGYYVAMLQ